ncbi:MAG: hypothetical protein L6R28_03345 [Planctomycetes bacterium]|nr:hypothetical protein [Planctomycetota bacterium]
MAEPESKPRRRFQLHLSTCIIVMVVAGVLVWANAVPRKVGEDTCDGMRGNFMERGWPWSFHERTEMIEAFRAKIHAWVPADSIESYQHPDWAFSPTNALADFFLSLTILAAVTAACEWWIRRRAAPEGINAQKTES